MGVYISNMEMPTSCWRCMLSQLYEKPREMLVCKIAHEEVLRHKIDSNCPLVPVPPHGRLIDADAFLADMACAVATKMQIEDAPTVIESTIGQLNSDPAVNEAEEGE